MDITTSMLGLRLAHPFVAGASPLGWDIDPIKRLEDGGCAAVVLPSLFEEQITLAAEGRIRGMDLLVPEWGASLKAFPGADDYVFKPHEYAEHVARVKRAVQVPVIGSLNGTSMQSWLTFSRLIEQAGADALELNMYEVVADLNIPGVSVERQLTQVVSDLKRFIRIPLAVKVSPFFAAFGNVARQLDRAGADGLVIFNRFYQPDINIETMEPHPEVALSTSGELLLRLRWLAILYGRVRPSLVVTGGVDTPVDGIKALLAGADAVQMVSTVIRNGPDYFTRMRTGLEQWMDRHGVERLGDVRGRASLQKSSDPTAFERAHYIRTLQSWKPAER